MVLGVAIPLAVFEVLCYTCLGVCVWHALRQGALRRARLIELGTGVLYGLTLETLTILTLHAYQYGHFLVMFGPVPLTIGVGWGIILYSAMSFAGALPLPAWVRPPLVGLLGLNIDLSMDAVAIRLHMWEWFTPSPTGQAVQLPYSQQWFGVPFGNFFAWFVVLCSAAALFWLVRPLTARPGWRGPLAALGALLVSVAILTVLDELVVRYEYAGGIKWLPVLVVVAGALAVVARGAWAAQSASRPWVMGSTADELVPAIVPAYFHLFFFTMLFVAGFAAQVPVLVAVSLTMLAVGIVLHGMLARRVLARRPASVGVAPVAR